MRQANRAIEGPAFRRPFHESEYRGYFVWKSGLTRALQYDVPRIYHASHEAALKANLAARQLLLRSECDQVVPRGIHTVDCVWVGLNWFKAGNHYGPFVMTLPTKVLEGRTFMVFRRNEDRLRYFLVEYNSPRPIYEFRCRSHWLIKPESLFNECYKHQFEKQPGAIYDLVLKTSLYFDRFTVRPHAHEWCIGSECEGCKRSVSRAALQRIARWDAANRWRTRARQEDHLRKHFQLAFPLGSLV